MVWFVDFIGLNIHQEVWQQSDVNFWTEGQALKDPHMVAAVIEGLSGSWEPPLLAALDKGPLRSGELRRILSGGLDYRVFQDTVTRLTDHGLICRTDRSPAGVYYELTAHGRAALGMLEGVATWIDRHPQTAARIPRTSPRRHLPAGSHHDAGAVGEP